MIVLADDLTGLSETAGLFAAGGVLGKIVALSGQPFPNAVDVSDVLFVNLGCRSFSHARAADRVRQILAQIQSRASSGRLPEPIYWKVDSAGRGPLGAMLLPALESFPGLPLPFLLANPATNRSVRAGHLLIDAIPLHQSHFARDPLHPATTASIEQLLRRSSNRGPDSDEIIRRVHILDGASEADLHQVAMQWKNSPIAAGSAPFLAALYRARIGSMPIAGRTSLITQIELGRTMAVVGSSHPAARQFVAWYQTQNHSMSHPAETGHTLFATPDAAGESGPILQALIEAACTGFQKNRPNTVILIGGETAQNFIDRVQPGLLSVTAYKHPVAFLHSHALNLQLCIMPGSYAAPETCAQILFGFAMNSG